MPNKEYTTTAKEWNVSFATINGGHITQTIQANSKHLALKWVRQHPLFKRLYSIYPT